MLQQVRENRDSPLASAAFKYASILYAKPYKFSHGDRGKYKLDGRYVPIESLELHKLLIDDRDQIHAHTDIRRMNAIVEPIHFQDGTRALISRSIVYSNATLEQINQLIALIEGTIDALEMDRRIQEARVQ